MKVSEIIEELQFLSTPEHFAKMAHFGINNSKALGVKVPSLRKLAKTIGVNHQLALELWSSEVHEARLLASMIANPKEMTESQIDDWVCDFDSWDICDVCCDLLAKTPFVYKKIEEYSTSDEEFVKRTAFALICELAFYDKNATDEFYDHFFEIIERESWDDRNFVRKAVNWALRQIGKRNNTMRLKAIETAEHILYQGTKSARWIANDAIRELNNVKVIARVNKSRK